MTPTTNSGEELRESVCPDCGDDFHSCEGEEISQLAEQLRVARSKIQWFERWADTGRDRKQATKFLDELDAIQAGKK